MGCRIDYFLLTLFIGISLSLFSPGIDPKAQAQTPATIKIPSGTIILAQRTSTRDQRRTKRKFKKRRRTSEVRKRNRGHNHSHTSSHGPKKRAGKRHHHRDDHGHSHASHRHSHKHDHSGFHLGLGANAFMAMGGDSASAGTPDGAGGGGDSHAGHGHALMLQGDDHAGHNHGTDSTGNSEAGGSGNGFTLALNITPGYRLSENFGLLVNLGYDLNLGLIDPSAGMAFKMQSGSRTIWNATATFSAPASEFSQMNGLVTTANFTAGPTWRFGKLSVGVQGAFAYSVYNGPAATEVASRGSKSDFGLTDDHDEHDDHEDHADEIHDDHEDDGDDHTDEAGHDSDDHGHEAGEEHENDADALVDHDHDHDETQEAVAADRQSMLIGGKVTSAYKITRSFDIAADAGLNLLSSESGRQTYQTQIVLSRATLKLGGFSASGWLGLNGVGEGINVPTTPAAGLGFNQEM